MPRAAHQRDEKSYTRSRIPQRSVFLWYCESAGELDPEPQKHTKMLPPSRESTYRRYPKRRGSTVSVIVFCRLGEVSNARSS
jgi:hypothetical protein